MRRFLCIAMMVLLASCANKKEEEIPRDVLYARAMTKFKSNRFGDALKDFEKLETNYDFVNYQKAMIMMAYAHYSLGDYDDSLMKIYSIKKLNIENLEYVYYLEILNKYNMVMKTKRDLSAMVELYTDINTMLLLFPESMYNNDILEKNRAIFSYLVESELDIAKYYIKNNNLIGALTHLKEITDKYPENNYVAEIYYLIYKLYIHIGYREGSDLYRELLYEKYRDTKWYKKIND